MLWEELGKEYKLPSPTLDGMKGYRGNVSWDEFPDDEPLKTFFDHSDCDGDLSPLECVAMAPRIRKLVASWDGDLDKSWDMNTAIELAEGMELAASLNERLEFC